MKTNAFARNYSDDNNSKANFDHIYALNDPREYYRVLYGLDYVIPDLARSAFRGVIRSLEALRGHPLKILDIGCSFGINAALLKYPLNMERLAARYRDLDLCKLTSDELIDFDRLYFSSWPKERVSVVGLDTSKGAIAYARSVGLIDDGIVANLETMDLTREQASKLEDIDLIISTGAVGYVGPRTFSKVLAAIKGHRPWVASFVLRMFDHGALESLYEDFGLRTEKLKGVTFVQRRFHTQAECLSVLGKLAQRDIPTEGKEADGLYHAEFFLSRPEQDIPCLDLEELASVTSGANLRFGRRFRVLQDSSVRYGN